MNPAIPVKRRVHLPDDTSSFPEDDNYFPLLPIKGRVATRPLFSPGFKNDVAVYF